MSAYFKKLLSRSKQKEEKIIKVNNVAQIADMPVKLDIVNTMYQTMALTVSEIAKTLPKNFDLIKYILTEYALLLEYVLVFRSTGESKELIKKLSEFMIRSVEGYLTRYEDDDEIIEEELPIKDIIMNGLIEIEKHIEKMEVVPVSVSLSNGVVSKSFEDWRGKPKITKRGGLPSLDTPIANLKGIGEKTANELEAIGVKTLDQYIDYLRAQSVEDKESE